MDPLNNSSSFIDQIAIGDWVTYNENFVAWVEIRFLSSLLDHEKEHLTKKYKIYDIGIFKRTGLIQLHLQESCHVGSNIHFTITVNADGTSAEYMYKQFPEQFLIKVENETT